jgi:hypothetical protein
MNEAVSKEDKDFGKIHLNTLSLHNSFLFGKERRPLNLCFFKG